MADYKKAITKFRNGLAKATRQGSQPRESFPQGVDEGKEQAGRGPDDSPVHRENCEIIPTPHFS